MVDIETARNFCLALSEVDEFEHFNKPAYRVKKKTFATLWLEERKMVVKLSKADQALFCEEHQSVSPVNNKWGKQGWTFIDLNNVNEPVLQKLVRAAWMNFHK